MGYSTLYVVNLYAWRATAPEDLRYVDDPVGPHNDSWILHAVTHANLLVLAWGNGAAGRRSSDVYERLRPWSPMRIGPLTKNGEPAHPLYLPYNTPLEPMNSHPIP